MSSWGKGAPSRSCGQPSDDAALDRDVVVDAR